MSKTLISSQNMYKRIFKGWEVSLNVSLLLTLKKRNLFFPYMLLKRCLKKQKEKDTLICHVRKMEEDFLISPSRKHVAEGKHYLINLNVTDLKDKTHFCHIFRKFSFVPIFFVEYPVFSCTSIQKVLFQFKNSYMCMCAFLLFDFFCVLGFVIWNTLLQSQNYTRRYIHRGLASVQALPLSHLFFLLHMVAFVRFILSFLFDRVN